MLHDFIDLIFLNHPNRESSSPRVPPTNMSSDPQQQQQQPAACPVDHKSREAWLEKARAAAATATDSSATALPPSHPPVDTAADGASCPVDHGAREVWTQQARAASEAASTSNAPSVIPASAASSTATQTANHAQTSPWTSYIPRIPFLSSPNSGSTPPPSSTPQAAPPGTSPLGTDREVSTIPRTSVLPATTAAGTGSRGGHAPPANNEQETGADGTTGNWIYPSERMFFEAMKRKGHDPRAADMQTVVPIHNAVNERAWAEIKAWEGPWIQGSSCDGPRLHSFSGLSTQMSPKARFNTLLGYQAPFDRHDWVVDRCGREIDYVIDFYAGRNGSSGVDGKLSFYLDVRPKLNSWEGVKMRAFRAMGLA
ncbi:cytochrome c/c1 heme-lyase [Xylariaceae sp. FL1651]|nr:cytochrome c/c1 heme-lyase [Xylariaceae sp. FL1651]